MEREHFARKVDVAAIVGGPEMMPARPMGAVSPSGPPRNTLPSAVHSVGWGAGAYPSPTPPPPFSLESSSRDEDAALLLDARTGFSHLLPGRPALAHARLGDPPADATIHLQDAPITLRYRLEAPSVHAASAAELAHRTAARVVAWRGQMTEALGAATVAFANPSWLVAWGVEAAAVSTYDVASSHANGSASTSSAGPSVRSHAALREDLFVLVRQGMVYVVTWTYPRGFTDDPAYASFASVAEATMIWDPLRWEQRGRIWPDSAIVGPGIYAAAKPQYQEAAHALARVPLAKDVRAHVLMTLASVITNAGAPWVELRPDFVETNRQAVVAAFRDPELRAFLTPMFAGIRTAHDLRGLAILFGRALDERRSSRPPPRS